MSQEIKYHLELKVQFDVDESELEKLRLTPDRYARYYRDSIQLLLSSGRTYIQHHNVEVTVEH